MPNHPTPAPTDAPDVAVADQLAGLPLRIALVDLDEDLTQPRQEFPDDRQQELTASVAAAGIQQPLLVRPVGNGRYVVVDGARRKRAAEAAGLREVPCVLCDEVNWLAVKQSQLITNGFHQSLTPLELAQTLELLWLGHQIAAFEADAGDDGTQTAVLVAAAGSPARQIAALRDRLCALSGFPNRDAYLSSGAHVRVSWTTVLEAIGLVQMTADQRKRLLSLLDLSLEAQDALAGVDVSQRTLRELAQRPPDEQQALIAQAQDQDDVGAALRQALSAPLQTDAAPERIADWSPEALAQALDAADTADAPSSARAGQRAARGDPDDGLPLDVDADQRATFEPDPTLALPFSTGPGRKLVSERGDIGRGSLPPDGHEYWSEDEALQLSGALEAALKVLDGVGPGYLSEQHCGWLQPMWQELVLRLDAAGLAAQPD
ncbi:MAG TPA: ParB/RepB/Spo0J family partition protein [Herpetosiphonaceae bacterium]